MERRRPYKRYLIEEGEDELPRRTAHRRRQQRQEESETDSEHDLPGPFHGHEGHELGQANRHDDGVHAVVVDFEFEVYQPLADDVDVAGSTSSCSDSVSEHNGSEAYLDGDGSDRDGLEERAGVLPEEDVYLQQPGPASEGSDGEDRMNLFEEAVLDEEEAQDYFQYPNSDSVEGSEDEHRNVDHEEEELYLQQDLGERLNDRLQYPEHEEGHMEVPNGDEGISSEGSDLTKMDSLMAVLAYSMKHHLTGVALQDLIDLINLHCPQSLPQSKYLFNKTLNGYGDSCDFHFYCDCVHYLGKMGQLPENCGNCGVEINQEVKVKEGKFFLYMPLGKQLKYLLTNTNVGIAVANRENVRTDGEISDIMDGDLYQELVARGVMTDNDVSLTWNTDGVPVFKSSRSSMWPVMCLVNELPAKMRRENIMLTALWFGEKKPDMAVFLKPFVDECNVLSSTGLKWMHNGEEKTSKVFPLICTVDSVARPLLQNMMQFNGFFGCSLCKQNGSHEGGALRYPYQEPPAEKRTPEETKRQSVLAAEGGRSIEGVKGVSILSFLMYFNIISSFVPDFMHSVCLGTVRRFLNLWLDPANRHLPFYLGNMREELNNRIVSLRVCKEISRVPRSLKDIHFWKASEWRTFLYVSPIILNGLLPLRYLAHWTMLVSAIFNLNSNKITQDMLKNSSFLLRKFVMYLQPLYGVREATFNVHLLLHLPDSVQQWGPLWATSAFPFESYNGYLKKLFSGTNYVPQQIFQSVCRLQDLVRNMPFITSLGGARYVSKLIGGERVLKKFARFRSGTAEVVCIGRSKLLHLNRACKHAVEQYLGEEILEDTVQCFERFIVNNILLSTKHYSQKFKRNDSVIKTPDFLGEIISFISFKNHNCDEEEDCRCNEHVLLLIERLDVNRTFRCMDGQELGCSIDFISEITRGSILAIKCDTIVTKGILVSIGDDDHVVTLPNMLEAD